MSALDEQTLLDLMAYADGELDAAGVSRVEALLASNGEAQAFLASLGAVGDWVRASGAAQADAASADRIADDVLARVEPHVASLADARARRARRLKLASAGAAVVALAAGVMLIARPHEPIERIATVAHPGNAEGPAFVAPGEERNPPQAQAASEAEPDLLAQGGDGVEVNQVESTTGVSVFYVPAVSAAKANVSSVVIWLGDDEAQGSGERK